MINRQVNQDIRVNLRNISQLIQAAGDNEICRFLEKIIQSPDQIVALHAALGRGLKRQTRKQSEIESALGKRKDWFRNFQSSEGKTLIPKAVDALARITKDWELPEPQINTLLACSTLWISDPGLFWHGGLPDKNVLRSCYNDLERIHEIDPLRRRILMITLSDQVQQFQKKLRECSKSRSQPRKERKNAKRDRILLPGALETITRRLWPKASPVEQEKIKTRIKDYSRAGWKWKQLIPVGMLLSFHNINMKGFERHPWTLEEIQAMNAFMKTLPQYRIRSHLENAFNRIIASYSGVSNSHTAHNVPDSDTNLNIENGPTRPVTQATQPIQEPEVTLRPPGGGILPPVISTRSIHSEIALDDTQPAGFLSSVERGPHAWPIYQSLPEPETTQVPSPKATDHSTSANPENNSEFPPSVRPPDMLFSPTQRALRPEALHRSLEQTGPREEPAEFTQMTPQQEDSTYELAWPLASWELASYDIQLDWGAGLPENTLQNYRENNLVSSMSNPFPPCDSLEPLASLEWDLFRSANGLSFGENPVLN